MLPNRESVQAAFNSFAEHYGEAAARDALAEGCGTFDVATMPEAKMPMALASLLTRGTVLCRAASGQKPLKASGFDGVAVIRAGLDRIAAKAYAR